MKNWKQIAKPTIVGAVIAIGLIPVSGMMSGIGFMETSIAGLMNVGTLVSASALAWAGSFISESIVK